MAKRAILILIIILMVVVLGLLIWYFTAEKSLNQNQNVNVVNVEVIAPPKNTVWIIDGNFTPSVLTVGVGDKVTWVNKDDVKRRVASDPHPTSTKLPELVSNDLAPNDQFSFSFTNSGEWGYHDYLNPIKKGRIIVQ